VNGKRIVVVGAGIGGLGAAALLAARGGDVTVVERQAAPGGKLRQVDTGGVAVDGGPTVFTMRWVFDAIFDACGASLDSAVTLTAAHVLARHAWGADRLDLFADDAASADAIGTFAGARDAAGFRAFMAEARAILATLTVPFLQGTATSPLGLTARIGPRGLPGLAGIHPFARLWDRTAKHFADPRLRQLFGRYATYSGSSPFDAPATLMLIAAVEADGVWLVEGGMSALARALAALATRHGARLRYDAEVTGLDRGGATLASGERIAADRVVFNGDPQALATGLLGPALRRVVPPLRPRDRSLSALVWTIDAETSGFPLVRHNVFFGGNYAREFADLAAGRLPHDPSVYLCAQDRPAADATPPAGPERLQLIVNAPAVGDGSGGRDGLDSCAAATFERLRACGLTLTPRASVLTTPEDFAQLFPASAGALYGRATHGPFAAFRRPGATTKLPWLFLAGGATHPGAGVPMAALSGIRAAEAVLADHGNPAVLADHGNPAVLADHGNPAVLADHGNPAVLRR